MFFVLKNSMIRSKCYGTLVNILAKSSYLFRIIFLPCFLAYFNDNEVIGSKLKDKISGNSGRNINHFDHDEYLKV